MPNAAGQHSVEITVAAVLASNLLKLFVVSWSKSSVLAYINQAWCIREGLFVMWVDKRLCCWLAGRCTHTTINCGPDPHMCRVPCNSAVLGCAYNHDTNDVNTQMLNVNQAKPATLECHAELFNFQNRFVGTVKSY